MAKIIIDLSGRGGLLERHQGDLTDTSPSPHLRYLGPEGKYADGIWNPFTKHGYTSPAVATYTSLTGTIAAPIVSFAYDNANDVLYAAEDGENILQLAGLDDTSVANYISITSGDNIKDLVLYELNNTPTLMYVIDSGDTLVESTDKTGMYIGYKTIDTTKFIPLLDYDVLNDWTGSKSTTHSIVRDADADGSGTDYKRIAQSFDADDLSNLTVTGIEMALERQSVATPASVTVKVSIQGNDTKSDGPYTDQGAWATSTSYAINDVVSSGGNDYNCINAHTSGASTEPGVGGSWENEWNQFIGSPDGTDLVSASLTADNLPDDTGSNVSGTTQFAFSSPYTLTAGTKYWIVVEEVGSNLGAGEEIATSHTSNNATAANAFYPNNQMMGEVTTTTPDYWENWNPNRDQYNTMHFTFMQNEGEDWSKTTANGAFGVETGQDTFLYTADNGLLYWFTGRQVHTVDGSSTGGVNGTVNEGVLLFPSYITVPDVAETRGRMYIGVQTSTRTDAAADDDDNFFGAHRAGIYVWDRRSQIAGNTDFFPCPGAKEIRNIFTTSTGDIAALTVGNSNFTELRQLSGNQFAVIQTMEKEAYPAQRRGISQAGNFTTWLGKNGYWYAYGQVTPGEPLALYKIGNTASLTNFDTPGAIYVGHEDSTNNQMAIYAGWSDTSTGEFISKWYPNGEGTLDSNAQQAVQGDVYTKVYQLPSFSTIKYIRGFHMPGSTSNATVAATIKCYINQSTTAAWEKNLTFEDLERGWFEKEWNQPNVNFIQFEIEWATGITINADTYRPMYLEVQTGDEDRINP